MDRFHALKTFICVAKMGGFAKAARALNMSPPAATRAISALEERIGTRLFVRTTRSVRLTESGQGFLIDAQRILSELEEAEEAALGGHRDPRGELKISAPVLFGRQYVTPLLAGFLNEFEQVTAQTLYVDRVVNMMDEGIDVAVRIGPLADSSLRAIKVGQVRRVVFGATDYVIRHGAPAHPRELGDHTLILAQSTHSSVDWVFSEHGKELKIPIRPRIKMNTNDGVLSMVEQGFGLSRLLSYQVAPYVAGAELQTVLTDFEQSPIPIHVLHPEGRMVSAKVRACVDHLVEGLRANLHLQT